MGVVEQAAALVFGALVAGLTPDPVVNVAEWAQAKRMVSAEESPRPGPWDNATVPYLVEPMECASLSHPARDVVVIGSAQTAKTQVGVNALGTVIDMTPCPVLVVLPTIEESRKYNRLKLEPALNATPVLRAKVVEQKSRDEKSSTTTFKRFAGGNIALTGANSASGLQMVSVRMLILEEVAGYPLDVDGRGDPVDLALARTKAFTEFRKVLWLSTTGIEGICRITAKYEESDQRRFYVPCPHCETFQVLHFQNLKWEGDLDSGVKVWFQCLAHGCIIDPQHKVGMVAKGIWLKAYAGDDAPSQAVEPQHIARHRSRSSGNRHPGFHIWQAYSPFVPWEDTVIEWLKAKDDAEKEKVFTQQALGIAWKEKGDAPDWEKLKAQLQARPRGVLPPGALILVMGVDVQGNRLEWDVWAFGIGKTRWHIDSGVLEGDTGDTGDQTGARTVWTGLDEVMRRTWVSHNGRPFGLEMTAIDAGYNTQAVYDFVRRRGPRVIAVKGMPGHMAPAIGTATKQDFNWKGEKIKGGVLLWPVGTWTLKSALYAAARKTLEGPGPDGQWRVGAVHLSADVVDDTWLKQFTAEQLITHQTRKGLEMSWEVIQGRRNERLDTAIYAAAAVAHLGIDRFTPETWARLICERGSEPERAQADLFTAIISEFVPPPPPPQSRSNSPEALARKLAGFGG